MYKEYFMFIFVAFVALNFLPYTEKIVFGEDEAFSFKDLDQIERFGTEQMTKTKKKKGSDTSTNKILKLLDNNRNKFHESLNKRLARSLKDDKKIIFQQIEKFINNTIKGIKKNKEGFSARIIKGSLFNSSDFDKFKKELYTKLDAANMKSLYEPIKDYFGYLNKDLLPGMVKKLILKKKFSLTDNDKKVLIKMVTELKNTSFNFTMSELIFMMTIMSDGEHTTLNAKEKVKMIEKNSKYLKKKNPLYNLSFFIPSLKIELLDKMRFETFLFYLTFLYRKFHKQLIMFRKLSLIKDDKSFSEIYKRFLTNTAKFVSLVNVESLKSFKRVS
jgi:hypothetical protein